MHTFIRLIIAVLLSIAFFGCSTTPQKTMRVGSVLWPGYEPLFLARSLGYYQGSKIQLVDYLSNTDAMHAFENNALEAAAFTLDEALQIINMGIAVEIILIMDVSHGGDVILANPGITSMRDLKGKRVGVESGAVGAYVLSRALEVHGLSLDDIHVVSVLASEQPDAFGDNIIDAAVSFDPVRTKLVNEGKQQIFDSTEIPDEVIDVLVVHKEYASTYPKAVKVLIDGWFKALKFTAEKPDKAAEYSAIRHKITPDEFLKGQKLMRFPSREENLRLLSPGSSPLIKTSKKLSEVLNRLNKAQGEVDLASHLNPGYLP